MRHVRTTASEFPRAVRPRWPTCSRICEGRKPTGDGASTPGPFLADGPCARRAEVEPPVPAHDADYSIQSVPSDQKLPPDRCCAGAALRQLPNSSAAAANLPVVTNKPRLLIGAIPQFAGGAVGGGSVRPVGVFSCTGAPSAVMDPIVSRCREARADLPPTFRSGRRAAGRHRTDRQLPREKA